MDTLDYQLLDTGYFKRLEKIGPYKIVRPAPAAVWASSSKWTDVDAEYIRMASGKGEWKVFNNRFPEQWLTHFKGHSFELRRTSFGHLGLFFEHSQHWPKLQEFIKSFKGESGEKQAPKALNLFAYTGGATLAMAEAGAEVVHLDSSKSSVQWARSNAELSGLKEKPVRWIVEDATTFVNKEVRRESVYNIVVLDPPTYGRGGKNQIWKIEKDLLPLLKNIKKITDPKNSLVFLTSHSPGYTPMALENILKQVLNANQTDCFEMFIDSKEGCSLVSGAGAIGYRN